MRKPTHTGWVAAILAFGFLAGHGQEEEARPTLAEAKSDFEKADAELNRVYREVRAAISEWKFKSLQESQKEWLSYRDARAEADATFNGGNEFEDRETETPFYWEALTSSTETRTEMIAAWKDDRIEWTGLWTDGYGGWLLIEETEKPGELGFHIQVVRGPTSHLGSIFGIARRNKDAAFFSDNGDPDYHFGDAKEETWLWFSKNSGEPTLKLDGINTQSYHGARAFFDGVYTRLRAATAEDRKMFEFED